MKVWLPILLLITGVILIASPATTQAAEYRSVSGDDVAVSGNETVEDDLFIAGDVIIIEGNVAGDVYAAGEQITLSGDVSGDVFAAGTNITIVGDIGGSVRAAGESLNLTSPSIGGGVTFFGSRLTQSSVSEIAGGVIFFAETINLEGSVAYGLSGFATSTTLNGQIGTQSRIYTEQLSIGDSAVIAAPIEYRSDTEAQVAAGAQVESEITRTGDLQRSISDFQVDRQLILLWSYISALFVGSVLLLVFRQPMLQVSETIRSRWLLSFGVGVLAMFLAIPIGILFIISLIGIPLALLWWTAFAIGLYISKFLVGITVGAAVLRQLSEHKHPQIFLSLLLGLSTIFLVKLLPIIGPLSTFVVAAMAIGAVIINAFSRHQAESKPKAKS